MRKVARRFGFLNCNRPLINIRRFVILGVSVSLWLQTAEAQQLSPETENEIRAILDSPALRDAQVGLCVLDIGSAKNASTFPAQAPVGKPFRVLFEKDAGKKFMPASNMKLFTAAIALKLLGAEKTFPTEVWGVPVRPSEFRRAPVGSYYTPPNAFQGDMILLGGGDPSLSAEDLEDLAAQIKQRNISGVAGYLIGDGLAFTAETMGGRYPFGWTLDDSRWYYGPEISALAIERNQMDIVVESSSDKAPVVGTALDSPLARYFRFIANVQVKNDLPSNLSEEDMIQWRWLEEDVVHVVPGMAALVGPTREVAQPTLVIQGNVPSNFKLVQGIALPNPPAMAAARLHSALINRLVITGPVVATMTKAGRLTPSSEKWAQHDSPPLKTLFQRLLKNSDNLYAEMLLRDAAFYHDGKKNGTAPRAHELLRKWLIEQGIDTTSLRFEDGSGLSRYNLLTPRSTAELLVGINRMKDGQAIWDALPIAATDGTLKKRMANTAAANNARAKTGTFSIASNLSGYVTTKDGRRLAVALYINFARDTKTAQVAQDKVFAALAGGTVVAASN